MYSTTVVIALSREYPHRIKVFKFILITWLKSLETLMVKDRKLIFCFFLWSSLFLQRVTHPNNKRVDFRKCKSHFCKQRCSHNTTIVINLSTMGVWWLFFAKYSQRLYIIINKVLTNMIPVAIHNIPVPASPHNNWAELIVIRVCDQNYSHFPWLLNHILCPYSSSSVSMLEYQYFNAWFNERRDSSILQHVPEELNYIAYPSWSLVAITLRWLSSSLYVLD